MGRFRKRWGDIVESEDGFTVQVTTANFPGVRVRYNEGPRTMDVFAEAMAKTQHFVLDLSTMAGWEPPNASETVDDATRQTVLDRIMAALGYAGYVIEPDGRFPTVRNQLEGRIQFEQKLANERRKWRHEDEVRHERDKLVGRNFTARRAVSTDVDLVATIISLSFERDPIWGRALALPDGRTDHHFAFWRLSIDGALRYPWTWLGGEGASTTVWIPPGGTEMTPQQEASLVDLAREHLGPASDNYLELLDRFSAAHPHAEPHYYLSLLGTHPNYRGQGMGMQLLAHNLALIDYEHMPAYLESTNPANNARYARVGFEPIGKFSYPGGDAIVTTMWRPAR